MIEIRDVSDVLLHTIDRDTLSAHNLGGKYLRGAVLQNMDLRSVNLGGADLRNADLSGADLSGAKLDDADLSEADLRAAILIDASLCNTNLSSTQIDGADLSGTTMSGDNFPNGTPKSWLGVIAFNTQLTGIDLSHGDLRGATFSGSHISQCKLFGGQDEPFNLRGTDFSACTMQSNNYWAPAFDSSTQGFVWYRALNRRAIWIGAIALPTLAYMFSCANSIAWAVVVAVLGAILSIAFQWLYMRYMGWFAEADDPLMQSDLCLRRGESCALHGNLDRAMDELDRATAFVASCEGTRLFDCREMEAMILSERAFARELLGDWEAALADYSLAIELKPDEAWNYIQRANTYEIQGQFDLALADRTSAIENADGSLLDFSYLSRARTHENLNHMENALADYDRAVEISQGLGTSSHAYARLARAEFHERREDYQGALTECDATIELEPSEPAYLLRAKVHEALGNEENAATDRESATLFADDSGTEQTADS